MRNLAAILKRNPQLRIAPGSMLLPEVASQPTAVIEHPAPVQIIPWANEREFQTAVIAERDRRSVTQPEYALLYHISNENAHRNPGVLGGICDLCLPIPRGQFGALYVELKTGAGKCSKVQLEMIYRLREAGNHCVVVWDSVDEVFRHIDTYLGLKTLYNSPD